MRSPRKRSFLPSGLQALLGNSENHPNFEFQIFISVPACSPPESTKSCWGVVGERRCHPSPDASPPAELSASPAVRVGGLSTEL